MSLLPPHRLAKWCSAIGSGILGIITLLSLLPLPTTIDTMNDNATIRFSANHWLVLSRGSCITVSWQVEHIREVYVNGEGVIGSGEKSACIDRDTQPALRVVFVDGTEKIYKLDIPILLTQPITWILVISGITLILIGIGLAIGQKIHLSRQVRIILRTTVGIGVALSMSLAIVEFGLRTYYTNFGTSEEKLLYTDSESEILATFEHNYDVIAAPFVNYVLNPDYGDHNKLGYRGAEIEIPKPKGVFRIVMTGDSMTYGQSLPTRQTYPYQLQEILHDYGYTNVEVINAGVIGYTSWETLTNLSFRLLELEPDLVIYYGSSNDLHARTGTPDCYQGINPRRGLGPLRQVAVPSVADPVQSTLYRYLEVNLGWVTDPIQFAFERYNDKLCQRADNGTDAEHIQENPPIYFRRNLRDIVAVARANDVRIVLSTQPYYQATDPKIMADWWKQGVDEHNQIILDLATELNALSIDLMAEIGQNPDFWFGDGIHPSPEGAHEYARLYADYLVKTGWLDAPNRDSSATPQSPKQAAAVRGGY
jgi:lysophospholipase L1-like esterase